MMNNLFKRTKETSYIPNNGNLKIPSREEFHRYAMNILYESCFCTDHPTDYTDGDHYWNEAHKNGTKSLHITNADVFIGASFTCSFFDGENLITKAIF